MTEKQSGKCRKFIRIFSGQILCVTAARQSPFHFGMAHEIVRQTPGHDVALSHNLNTFRHSLAYLRIKYRIMSTSEHNRVDISVGLKQSVDLLTHEIIRSRTVSLAVLDKRHPHRTGVSRHREIRVQLGDLDII